MSSFEGVIETISGFIPSIVDKTLITEWNRMLEEMKSERDIASNMKEVLIGNFDSQHTKKERQIREEGSEKYLKKQVTHDELD